MKRYIGCLLVGMFSMTPIVGAWTHEGELFPKPSVVPEFDLPYSNFSYLVSNHKKREGCVAWGGISWWNGMGGTYVDGKREGFWLESWHGGYEPGYYGYAAGYYVDDKREGRWLEFWPPGTLPTWVARGLDRHGQIFDADDFRRWIEESGGIVAEGRYVDGERLNRWILHRQKPRGAAHCASIVIVSEWGDHEWSWQNGC